MLLIITACSESSRTSGAEASAQWLTLTVGSSPNTLDPHLATGVPSWKILTALGEGLVAINGQTLEVKPAVAERWEISEDGLHFRFHLRDNAKWSNGEPVTAADFANSWERMLSPSLGNPYAQDLFAVSGARAFFAGDLKDFAGVGVKAVADNVLEITLEKYDPLFLKKLAAVTAAPVNRKAMEKHGGFADPANPWTRPGNFVGNGPFVLVKGDLNTTIEVRKNPHFWDADEIRLEGIRFVPADTETVQERLFRSGQIQLAYEGSLSAEKQAQYRANSPEKIVTQPVYGTYTYYFNITRAPFDNADVRKALAYAVDKELITRRVTRGGEVTAYSLTPPDKRYQPPKMPAYDPDRARELLARAGFPDGRNFPPVTIIYNTADNHRNIALAIQQMWKKELNIEVALENQEWQVFLSNRQNLNYSVARAGSLSSYADPIDFLDSFKSGHGMNNTGWSHTGYDDLVNKAGEMRDENSRFAALSAAESILLEELPVFPIYFYVKNFLVAPEVKGMQFNPVDLPEYRGVYIESDSLVP